MRSTYPRYLKNVLYIANDKLLRRFITIAASLLPLAEIGHFLGVYRYQVGREKPVAAIFVKRFLGYSIV